MTQEASNPSSPAPSGAPRKPRSWLWRLAAILVIVAVTVVMARFLSRPQDGVGPGGGPEAGASDEAFTATTSPGELPADHPGRKQEEAGLRNLLGLLVDAEEDDRVYQDPRNQDPKQREEFLSERFGLSLPLLPHANLPAGLLPKGAQVLAAFADPQAAGGRMVLVRIKDDVSGTLEAFCLLYGGQGWHRPDPLKTDPQTDRGWLVRFKRQGQDRYLYARAGVRENETLVAVFDPPH
jgi:hypothetical protein